MMKNAFHSQLQSEIPTVSTQCVCQICQCGKHKCPNHSDNMPGDFKTTFQHSYKPWRVRKEKPYNFDRQPQQHVYDRNELQSQYQREFKAHQLPQKEPRSRTYNSDPQPFYTDSDYRVNFKKHPVQMQPKRHTASYLPPARMVNWGSTYNTDFRKHPSTQSERFRQEVKDGPSCEPAFGTTIYKEFYTEHASTKPRKYKDPQQNNLHGDPGYMGNSTYQVDFIDNNRSPRACPVEQLPQRPSKLPGGRSHITFNSITNKWQ